LEANDLMDSRDKAIDDLSKLVNISVSYDNNNIANISVGGIFAADAAYAMEFDYSVSNNGLSLVTKRDGTPAKIPAVNLMLYQQFITVPFLPILVILIQLQTSWLKRLMNYILKVIQ
jgi:flagellar hook-associated protein FlgK